MTLFAATAIEDIRRHIGHPIIDCDAHFNEFGPLFREQFLEGARALGCTDIEKALASGINWRQYLVEQTSPMGQTYGSMSPRHAAMSLAERRDSGALLPSWGPPHSNMLDRATSYVPALLHERLGAIGIDYCILYPGSIGLVFPHIEPTELRQVACRVYNTISAESFRTVSDKMTPVAVIPMYTPTEAINELEYVVHELGYKVAMIGHVARPIPGVHRTHPELYSVAFRLDTFGLDSDYDYDPFWAKCAELKVPLVAHNWTYGIGFRRSPTNYIFNQTGIFAEAADFLCRSLFLGGVTRRFPTLKFQFLECGAGWACILYGELVGRWQKRNITEIRRHVRASEAGQEEFVRLLKEYGGPRLREAIDQHADAEKYASRSVLDDFAAAQIEDLQDVHDLFVPRFFFGCEADDPITPWAFNTKSNPLGARLRATLGSDMGHWDVPDMMGIVPEAFELVEKGLMSEDEFKQFTFENPCEMFAGVNPEFFKGTAIEKAVNSAPA